MAMPKMTACIYYVPEAYTTSGVKLMGRNAAGESFLRGFLSYSSASEFWAQVRQANDAQVFNRVVASYGRKEPVRTVDNKSLHNLSLVGTVFHPGPGIGAHALQRTKFGDAAWSLCGITHTTSSAGSMDAIAELITSPVQPWDALICTSAAVKDNVQRVLQAQVDYLKHRLGIKKIVLPQLPVIPLGIHTADFEYSEEEKYAARLKLSISPEDLVVLYMGRLSFHAKAHPLAMYQALEMAAKSTGKKVVLLECGWFANQFIEKAFNDAVKLACPSVKVINLDGRLLKDRKMSWAAADIFCSLSDNIQETFGITPIEAMASGLPAVVSDWDGYRDTVRDGLDGFRIPTTMPQHGLADDLALRHALEIDTYDMYCGHTCSLVSVDVTAAADVFTRLFNSQELRLRMGNAGRERSRSTYDWKAIIPQYEELWAYLKEIRDSHGNKLKYLPNPWPARMDPFFAFASYPTQTVNPKTKLILVDGDLATALKRFKAYGQLGMVAFAKEILPTDAEVELVLQSAVSPMNAENIVERVAPQRRAIVFRALSWLLKLSLLKVVIL